jgi:hypothetical protein
VHAQPLIDPADQGEHLGLQRGLSGELLLQALGAGVEDSADRGLAALRATIRIGPRQGRQQLADLAAFCASTRARSRSAASRPV